jgi:hypothetical protein
MPRYFVTTTPTLQVGVDYQNNGRVNALYVNNLNAFDVYAEAKLTDGRVFGQTFGGGESLVNFPSNLVTLDTTDPNEYVLTGIQYFIVRSPA